VIRNSIRSSARGALGVAGCCLLLAVAARAQGSQIDPVLFAPGEEPVASSAPLEPARLSTESVDPYALRLDEVEQLFDSGVVAWRRGEYAVAEERWVELLTLVDGLPRDVRGRERVVDLHALLHDLGNAAFRLERPLEAAGYYLAALRHAPRDVATRANLDLSRRAGGLEPEPDPDFLGSLVLSLGLVTPEESRWLALIGLLPLLTGLLGEAIRGGRAWRALAALGLVAAALAAAPLLRHELLRGADPVMVVEPEGVPLRAEPLVERAVIGELAPGDVVERIDALPDWVRIERPDGLRGWVPRGATFELVR
jgi:hypothetical protein